MPTPIIYRGRRQTSADDWNGPSSYWRHGDQFAAVLRLDRDGGPPDHQTVRVYRGQTDCDACKRHFNLDVADDVVVEPE
ncbi:MAG TPA: hypothetical protein VE967_05055 [Gemmatimonadaceae bacterium]|nr:hypothetical protein [Gemmatimonadaceae bacterium]